MCLAPNLVFSIGLITFVPTVLQVGDYVAMHTTETDEQFWVGKVTELTVDGGETKFKCHWYGCSKQAQDWTKAKWRPLVRQSPLEVAF